MRKDHDTDRLASKETARREAMKRAFEEAEKDPIGGPLITISRDYFCGGGTVAKKLAAKLGWNLYDRELIESIAADRKAETSAIKAPDKNISPYIQEWANEVFLPGYAGHVSYMRGLIQILLSIVKDGNAIVIGRGAHLLIPDDRRLAVRLTAPLEWRIDGYMHRFESEREEARARIKTEDSRRKEFLSKNFHKNIDDPLLYNLVINTAGMDPSTIQQVIISALRTRFDLTDSTLAPIRPELNRNI